MKGRLVIAIITGLLAEGIIVAAVLWGLPEVDINIPLYGLILICVAYGIYEVISFKMGSHILRKKPVPGMTTMVGIEGRAVSRLAPDGYVRIQGELWSAVSDCGDIDVGEDITVVRQSGLKVVVLSRRTDNSAEPQEDQQLFTDV